MHRLRAAETGDIEAMTDLLLRHGPNPWNHLPEEGVRAHLRAIADGEVRAVLAERDDRLLGFASFRRTEDFAHYQPQRADAPRAYICEAVVHICRRRGCVRICEPSPTARYVPSWPSATIGCWGSPASVAPRISPITSRTLKEWICTVCELPKPAISRP